MTRCTSRAGVSARKRQKLACSVAWPRRCKEGKVTMSLPCSSATRSRGLRQLYTDQDDVLFDAARPLILNGIEDVVSRPDLADRALFLTLPYLSAAQRRPERTLWREFDRVRPRLLGALLMR